jgi:hypothetical protein
MVVGRVLLGESSAGFVYGSIIGAALGLVFRLFLSGV